jgi:hypothetical protein
MAVVINKKILICCIIAVALIVGVSFTSVVGFQSVESNFESSPLLILRSERVIDKESKDCNCLAISENIQIIIYKLLARLQFIFNIISLKSGNNPDINKEFSKISNIIKSNDVGDIFCDTLYNIVYTLITIAWKLRFSFLLLYFIIGTIAQNLHVIYDIFC